jgi:hypothetical protein
MTIGDSVHRCHHLHLRSHWIAILRTRITLNSIIKSWLRRVLRRRLTLPSLDWAKAVTRTSRITTMFIRMKRRKKMRTRWMSLTIPGSSHLLWTFSASLTTRATSNLRLRCLLTISWWQKLLTIVRSTSNIKSNTRKLWVESQFHSTWQLWRTNSISKFITKRIVSRKVTRRITLKRRSTTLQKCLHHSTSSHS